MFGQGEPIPNCIIETWETDEQGFYDTVWHPFYSAEMSSTAAKLMLWYLQQYSDRATADCRGRLRTDDQGNYAFRGVKPVSYPIPNDASILFTASQIESKLTRVHLLRSRRKSVADAQSTRVQVGLDIVVRKYAVKTVSHALSLIQTLSSAHDAQG